MHEAAFAAPLEVPRVQNYLLTLHIALLANSPPPTAHRLTILPTPLPCPANLNRSAGHTLRIIKRRQRRLSLEQKPGGLPAECYGRRRR
jgi:hypothetical protein